MHALIPEPIKGKQTDLKETVTLASKEDAVQTYKQACEKMLNPSLWHPLAGKLSAIFTVTDHNGEPVNELAGKGRYLQIDIPGPGPKAGQGFDWVQIELIVNESNPEAAEEYAGMKVRACSHPKIVSTDTAHFFQDQATSSFVIERKGNTVNACYYGRNEIPNTETGNTLDKIRNSLVASGAMAGLSEAQWSALLKAFLYRE
jgi:hypothetical protein